MGHPYIPNDTQNVREKMLRTIQLKTVDDVFSDISPDLQFGGRLKLPSPRSEYEALNEVEAILSKNVTVEEFLSFLGGGVWPHTVPAAVDRIAERTEFLTCYTPYQPEASQGLLQALFEYQSLICELLDMDVANTSMYDYASALGEAGRMACRVTGRNQIIYPHFICPSRLSTLRTYCDPIGIKLVEVRNELETGQVDVEDLKNKVSSQTAALYFENPSYLGIVSTNAQEIGEVVHDQGGLLIAGVDPISLGLLKPPGKYGADIAIGEGQPLGSYVNFGGPLLGLFACRGEMKLIRQMPGRIIGMTRTRDGETGYCMVLQTREQHIRREKATSNICTNQALLAIRAAVYISLLGSTGLRKLGERLVYMANYTASLLSQIDGVEAPIFKAPHFKEFTMRLNTGNCSIHDLNSSLLRKRIFGGLQLSSIFPELGEVSLLCVTERHRKEEIQRFVSCVAEIVNGQD
ncbi:MAG: aminomethyl-transferring glycine dehydrogenase subunit GcvPA [Candidatus Bathyarchaeia archaeon]